MTGLSTKIVTDRVGNRFVVTPRGWRPANEETARRVAAALERRHHDDETRDELLERVEGNVRRLLEWEPIDDEGAVVSEPVRRSIIRFGRAAAHVAASALPRADGDVLIARLEWAAIRLQDGASDVVDEIRRQVRLRGGSRRG